jgi:hypothetical protein
MSSYEFSLRLNREETDAEIEALYEAGCRCQELSLSLPGSGPTARTRRRGSACSTAVPGGTAHEPRPRRRTAP